MAGMVSFWPWALGAVGLLLFLVALSTLVFGKGDDKKRKLGCGFAVLAAIVWTLGFAQVLDCVVALRLAAGLVLLLGVVEALARPQGASVVRAGLFLLVGLLLAGPVLFALAQRAVPSEDDERVRAVEQRVEDVRDQLADLEVALVDLAGRRATLRADVAGLGHDSFAELRSDPEGLAKLEELGRVDAQSAQLEAQAAELRAALPQLERRLDDVRRLVERGEAVSESHVAPTSPAGLEESYEREAVRTIEELAEEERLRELFEREFPGSR